MFVYWSWNLGKVDQSMGLEERFEGAIFVAS